MPNLPVDRVEALREEIRKGRTAAALLPIIEDVLSEMIEAKTETWAKEQETERREQLWYEVNALRALRQELETRMESKTYAEHQLQSLLK